MAVRVHANCAMTLDGCLGGPHRTRLRISNAEDKRRVHELRNRVDAILVGVNTVVADDPKLTVNERLVRGRPRQPLRVVVDPRLRTPRGARLLSGAAPTLFLARRDAPPRPDWDVERLPWRGDGLDLDAALGRLADRGVRRVLVEGGAHTLTRFVEGGHVDRATVFIAPWMVGRRDAPRLFGEDLHLRRHLRLVRGRPLGDGFLMEWARR